MPFSLRRIASFRLTVALLLALPLFAIAGTIVPQGLDRSQYGLLYPSSSGLILGLGLDHYYQSLLYRGLLFLFAANLAACSAGRMVDGVRSVFGRGRASHLLTPRHRETWAIRLAALGFRVRAGAPLYATRRTWAFLGFPLVHAAPLAVLAGGIWGSLAGFVGTKNVYVGGTTETVYDWSIRSDRPLPFTLAVEDFRLLYYPQEIELRVAAQGLSHTVRTRAGSALSVSGTTYRLRVDGFDVESGDVRYRVETPSGELGPFSKRNAQDSPLRVELLAYRDAQVRRAEAIVALLGAGGAVRTRRVVAINDPLRFEGLQISLTAWDRDPQGIPYAGFQIVRDPGQGLTWGGSAALCLGLVLMLCIDGAWVREDRQGLKLRASRRGGLGRLGVADSAALENRCPPNRG